MRIEHRTEIVQNESGEVVSIQPYEDHIIEGVEDLASIGWLHCPKCLANHHPRYLSCDGLRPLPGGEA